MTIRLSPRQCRNARAMLKWNAQDLAARSHLLVRRIEGFERSAIRLMQHELKHLHDTFTKAGLGFKGESEVFFRLKQIKNDSDGGYVTKQRRFVVDHNGIPQEEEMEEIETEVSEQEREALAALRLAQQIKEVENAPSSLLKFLNDETD